MRPLPLCCSICDCFFFRRRDWAELGGGVRFLFIFQPLLQSINPLQQSLQHIRLGPSLLRNSIYELISAVRDRDANFRTIYAGALENQTRLACRPQPVAFDLGKIINSTEKLPGTITHLAFATRLAIHRFAWFVAHATNWQALDAHLRPSRHDGGREEDKSGGRLKSHSEAVTSLMVPGEDDSIRRAKPSLRWKEGIKEEGIEANIFRRS